VYFLLYAVFVCLADTDSSLFSTAAVDQEYRYAVDVDGAKLTQTSSSAVLELHDLENDRFRFDVDYRDEMHPSIRPLEHRYAASTALSAKFRSLCSIKLQIWWDDGREGTTSGHLELGQETTTNTYENHVFYFTEFDNKQNEIARFVMRKDQALYVIDHPLYKAPQELRDSSHRETQFMSEYLNRTGIQWRHYFGPDGPRPPPSLFMWPATRTGQVHQIESDQGYWTCGGTKDDCQSKEPVSLQLEVVSLLPRVFIIEKFLSDFEVGTIIDIAKPRISDSIVGSPSTGAYKSSTRTSLNAWIPRYTSDLIDSLYIRAANLLRLNEKIVTSTHSAEDIQVVHYDVGQKYDSHHDWGVSGYPESRFITLLLYLTDMPNDYAGGETAFPKGGADGMGFKVHPGKGSAVLFYNLLEDGNGDDLALHAALPVRQGEKWLANFWVWDPKRKD